MFVACFCLKLSVKKSPSMRSFAIVIMRFCSGSMVDFAIQLHSNCNFDYGFSLKIHFCYKFSLQVSKKKFAWKFSNLKLNDGKKNKMKIWMYAHGDNEKHIAN